MPRSAWFHPSAALRGFYAQIAGVALILVFDLGLNFHRWPILVGGLIDLPAHLLTALIILAALRVRPFTRFWCSAAAWSMLIDLDHLPGELGYHVLEPGTPRPVTHSLAAILVLCLLALLSGTSGTRKDLAWGAATGVMLHLVRDITDGGAIPLFWPLPLHGVALPYPFYVLTLLLFPCLGLLGRPLRGAGHAHAPPQPAQEYARRR